MVGEELPKIKSDPQILDDFQRKYQLLPKKSGVQSGNVLNNDQDNDDIGVRESIRGENSKFETACKNIRPSEQMSHRDYKVNYIEDKEHKVLFCEIFKCASTFWKGVLKSRVENVGIKMSTDGSVTNLDWFKFMFVREPYQRFMSFYVDKLYMPNPEFWRMFSELIPRCKNSKTKRKGCCEDVKFTELLEYVIQEIDNKRPLDPHLTPMHEHCHPCENKFDFIGKMENFSSDAYHVFGELNSRIETEIKYGDFRKESDKAAAKDYVYRLFRHKVWINRCLPQYDAMLRTWKALQIRGILDSQIDMPFGRMESEHVSKYKFADAVFEGLEKSTDKRKLKDSKTEAVRELFSTVPRKVLKSLRDIVRPDCEIFGYDIEPDVVFNNHDTSSRNFKTKYFVSMDDSEYKKYFGGDPSKLPSARIHSLSRMYGPGVL